MNPIDEYIADQDPTIQSRLTAIRETIRTAIPEGEERISYQMPTFWKGRNIIHYAAAKNHMVLLYKGDCE